MDTSEVISTQIVLPASLYQAIQQRAEAHGYSVSNEIIELLASSLELDDLQSEIDRWEAASDEDWMNMEAILATEG